jgi:hypothetical protein
VELPGYTDRYRRAAACTVVFAWHNLVVQGPNGGDNWPTVW